MTYILQHIKAICQAIRTAFKRIHLVDRILIVFMIILLAQSAYSILDTNTNTQTTGSVDIIIRTSAASIFGYFISGNFIKKKYKNTLKQNTQNTATPSKLMIDIPPNELPKSQIGFKPPYDITTNSIDTIGYTDTVELDNNSKEDDYSLKLQTIIISVIGIVCLIIIIVIRNFPEIIASDSNNASGTLQATFSQFRDFVSGCVGFLLGSDTTTSNRP